MTSTFDDYSNAEATIQVPTGAANGAKIQIPCSFTRMEGKRMILAAPERVGMSTPVSVEYNDAMFLGEVMACRSDSSGSYRVEIQVEQILTGLQSLIALRAGLLGAGAAAGSGFPGDGASAKAHALVPVALRNRNLNN